MNPKGNKEITIAEWAEEVRMSWSTVTDRAPFPEHFIFDDMKLREFRGVASDLLRSCTMEPDFSHANIHPDELTGWFGRVRTARKLFIDGYLIFGRVGTGGEGGGEFNKAKVADAIIASWRSNPLAAMHLLS